MNNLLKIITFFLIFCTVIADSAGSSFGQYEEEKAQPVLGLGEFNVEAVKTGGHILPVLNYNRFITLSYFPSLKIYKFTINSYTGSGAQKYIFDNNLLNLEKLYSPDINTAQYSCYFNGYTLAVTNLKYLNSKNIISMTDDYEEWKSQARTYNSLNWRE